MGSVDIATTRLAQLVQTRMWDQKAKSFVDKGPLRVRAYYDCNPPSKAHWTYKRFIQKVDPETGKPLSNPDDYASFQINPGDNVENLSKSYLQTLQGMSARLQKRFLKGEFADATPNQLFPEEVMDKWRRDGLPDMVRVVVGVDPSGSGDVDNADNDAIGIVVGGLGHGRQRLPAGGLHRQGWSCDVGPDRCERMAAPRRGRHRGRDELRRRDGRLAPSARCCGREGVRPTIKKVTASRGKVQRAEPFSALYEQGKIRHAGEFRELEDEMTAFSTYGYLGENSPTVPTHGSGCWRSCSRVWSSPPPPRRKAHAPAHRPLPAGWADRWQPRKHPR
jgi:hypothetical protein